MDSLAARVDAFAEKHLTVWKDPEGEGLNEFHVRYLYSNAVRARNTADTFWMLHAQKRFFDCQILARALYERNLFASYAVDPKRAMLLICSDILTEQKGLKQLITVTPRFSQALQDRTIELNHFKTLSGVEKVQKLQIAEIAKGIGEAVEKTHRSHYWMLCQYSHPSIRVSREGQGDADESIIRYHVLMSVFVTAAIFYQIFTGKPGVDDIYRVLVEDIKNSTLGGP